MLRRATLADVPHAARVIGDALAEYGLPFEPEGRDADVASFGGRADHDDFVVCEGDDVLGVGSIGPQGSPGVGWISKVFVASRARRRGVGRALLDALHEAAHARGYQEVQLRSRLVFEAAIAMYAAAGYVPLDDCRPLLTAGDIVLVHHLGNRAK